MELMSWEDCLPVVGEEDVIDTFERGVLLLIVPCEQPSIEVSLLQRCVVQETVKLPHQPGVDTIVVLILCMINHIEVVGEQPRASSNLPQDVKLGKE
jgi:hypothetical protein